MSGLVRLLNNIKSGYLHKVDSVSVKKNNLFIKFLRLLSEKEYIRSFEILNNNIKIYLIQKEALKNRKKILKIKIISKKSYQIYKKSYEIDDNLNQIKLNKGYGYKKNKNVVKFKLENLKRFRTVVISNKKGLLNQYESSYENLGGEIICILE